MDSGFIELVRAGGVAVMRTDTLYGIVARADDEQAVERVFAAKGRRHDKACIVLISDVGQLFDTLPVMVESMWPGRNSIILESPLAPTWLLRGGTTVAYRLPDDPELCSMIDQTGPLIAPSANPEGQIPASTISQAVDYFGDSIDAYVEGGTVEPDIKPSKVWRVEDGKWERIR